MEITEYGLAQVKTDEFAKAIQDAMEAGGWKYEVAEYGRILATTATILCTDENGILRDASAEKAFRFIQRHSDELFEIIHSANERKIPADVEPMFTGFPILIPVAAAEGLELN